MKLHLTIGVYPNGEWKKNAVRPEDLAGHIEYNKVMRFGRGLIVDGEIVYSGYWKEEELRTHYLEKIEPSLQNWKPHEPSKSYH